jgi:stage V sporulation protein K
MDARVFLQRALLAVVALFAIAAGLYISPWLGGASFALAAIFWVAVIIGLLYAGEAMPWIERFDSISALLRLYAPPLTDEEKQENARLAKEREQFNIWEDTRQTEIMNRARDDMTFFGKPPNQNVNNFSRDQAKPVQGSNANDESPKPAEPLLKLEELTGLASVKKTVRDYEDLLKVSKRRGDSELALQLNFAMLGKPGTGKTTVAQIMGRIFYDLGCLPTDKLVIARRDMLIGEFIGQTAPKTQKVLESALGGTLFIDEAYTLTPRPKGVWHVDPFNKEAIDTIVPFMETNKGKLAVIVAGYEEDIQEFLNSNPGLPGRFTNFIYFPDYTADECIEIFNKMVAKKNLKLTAEATAILPDIFSKLRAGPNWANARDVRTLFEEWTLRTQANRLSKSDDDDLLSIITDEDLRSALALFLENKERGSEKKPNTWLR